MKSEFSLFIFQRSSTKIVCDDKTVARGYNHCTNVQLMLLVIFWVLLTISRPFNSQMTQMTERTLVLPSPYLLRVGASSICLLRREIGKWVYFRGILLCSCFLALQGKTINSLVGGTEGGLTLTLIQYLSLARLQS